MLIEADSNKRIYLASPYTATGDQAIVNSLQRLRFREAQFATARLMTAGLGVFSPIVYSHELAHNLGLPAGFAFWKRFNESWIDWATDLWILCTFGWEDSAGVLGETKYARETHKPISYYDLEINELVKVERRPL